MSSSTRALREGRLLPITLTPAQSQRLAEAVAILEAKKAALGAGMSVAQMQAQVWSVDVQPLHSEVA
jgi:hypothetical protein